MQSKTMNFEVICDWLRISDCDWPPDHYTLLGLEKGERDFQKIEMKVHQQLAIIRSYQLQNPDLATEALNRIAEAFDCLTNSKKKAQYDQHHGFHQQASPYKVSSDADTVVEKSPIVLDWNTASQSPPIRKGESASSVHDTIKMEKIVIHPIDEPTEILANEHVVERQVSEVPTNAPIAVPTDPILESARKSYSAKSGIITKPELLARTQLTRKLLFIWSKLRKIFADPTRELVTEKEELFLKHWLTQVERHVPLFPPIFGRPAKPGYRIYILSIDEDPIGELKRMSNSVREELARDWRTSNAFLQMHRQFLLEQMRKRRREDFAAWASRVVVSSLNEKAAIFWGSLAFVCVLLGIAIFWLF